MLDITAVIVNLLTKELTQNCYESLRQHYPTVSVILIDNGSQDDSTEYIRRAVMQADATRRHYPGAGRVTAIINEHNLYHGPALHQGTMAAQTDYVFTLDSDCVVHEGGFLELMLAEFEADDSLFAVFHTTKPEAPVFGSAVWAMLFDRNKYLEPGIRSFEHHGSPAHRVLGDAIRLGYRKRDDFFLHPRYIEHIRTGT